MTIENIINTIKKPNQTITAGGTFGVQFPGDVHLRAGVQIVLTDGFFVESGAAVTFEIDPGLLP